MDYECDIVKLKYVNINKMMMYRCDLCVAPKSRAALFNLNGWLQLVWTKCGTKRVIGVQT